MLFIIFIILILFIMISVGFFTLIERKIMGFCHNRKGPNKVGYMGILQPFSDGIKLFVKEQIFLMNSNYFVYLICPCFILIQSLFMWSLFPFYVNSTEFSFGFLFFLCMSSLSVYGLIICGWSSNSIYSLLGCIRSISQAISYEVSLSLIMLSYFLLSESYNLIYMLNMQMMSWYMFYSLPIFFCWLSCCLAETNRSPFDFAEGESELVSGFNIEYGSGGFAFLFIAEYASIIFMSLITSLIFMGGNYYEMIFFFYILIMCFFFVWVRCSLPRYRYDKLMYLAWKCYLPMTLNYIFIFILFKLII
uniref:NADH-ubiquinone oxidoreductase chain 1 n=1 Tax=Ghauriana sinensis TaxID=2729071 RepID=A0A6M3RH21_9HEMI|nr:NADH dehydrogenase subunit 1 [Ghauriana sinensis]